ncbi:hypothetical protein F5884DRAFT_719738 [Xylogone sp. PMI_703]|nr:hypothetical protein F5884DRAFT_719738 [Xylogone sp. PMI_703]
MESPGSDMASESGDSSSAGPSPGDLRKSQIGDFPTDKISSSLPTAPLDDDSDSASDVSMSPETEDEEEQPHTVIHVNELSRPVRASGASTLSITDTRKRKHTASAGETAYGDFGNGHIYEAHKRRKPEESLIGGVSSNGTIPEKDWSVLPAPVWQEIFSFSYPTSLGHLLQVNRFFNACLDPTSPFPPGMTVPRATMFKPDSIWQISRRTFRPDMPHPLLGKSELDMWKLSYSKTCQFCGKKSRAGVTTHSDQWHPGPGENGVMPVWPFAVRSCGTCLQAQSIKEIDLLLSSSVPSPLMAALPFVFLTNDLHVIPQTTFETGQPPPSIKITKFFLKQHVEEIKREFFDVKSMGSAAAEEWLKGLEDRGKERRNDAVRWMRWEASGGLSRPRDTAFNDIGQTTAQVQLSSTPLVASNSASSTASSAIPVFQSGDLVRETAHLPSQIQLPKAPHPVTNSFPSVPPRFDTPSQAGLPNFPGRSHPPPRHERTKEEVAELRAARRSEIERRCALLEPPIPANILAHMTSFQAAMQIIKPLDDAAWEILKPRLLSQREEAEQRERERIAQSRVVQERADERRYHDVQMKEAKDVLEREWEDVQTPLRARIGGYADEIIQEGWGGGDKVRKDNCGKFAAEVLIYVRKRFYAEIAKDDAATRAAGQEPKADPPDGPYTRKLVLENMKWVFDTKIKPITEKYRKELFLCSVCDANFKFYGFEGVIQHYAAKHTSLLSLGSIVVHWKAEWPEDPPFNPDPTATKSTFYSAAPNTNGSFPATAPPVPHTYGYTGYQPVPSAAPLPPQNLHVYQESPGPYYGHPQYNDQYMAHQHGPYAPPPVQQQPAFIDNSGYPVPQYPVPQPHGSVPRYSEGFQDYSQPSYPPHYPAPNQAAYGQPNVDQSLQNPVSESNGAYAGYNPPGQYTSGVPPTYQSRQFQSGTSIDTTSQTPEYREQLLDIARHAREIWNAITTVKEIPGSIRVYTIIYHILKRSRSRFKDDPSLSMLIDGLSNVREMRPVRNINGLLCKACVLGLPGNSTVSPEKKHFSLPQLVSHFHSVHESHSGDGQKPDWKKDMIELPDISKVSGLAEAPGMDDQRLKLFAEALPEFFTSQPLPDINDKKQSASKRHYSAAATDNSYRELAPSRDNHEKYYGAIGDERSEYHSDRPKAREGIAQGSSDDQFYQPVEQSRDRRSLQYREDFVERQPRSPEYQSRPRNETDLHSPYAGIPINRHSSHRLPDDGYQASGSRDLSTSRYRDMELQPSAAEYRVSDPRSYRQHDTRPPFPDRVVDISTAPSSYRQQLQGTNANIKPEPVDAGSEDGELRGEPGPKVGPDTSKSTSEANDAAERFLSQFLQNEPTEEEARKAEEAERQKEEELRAKWEAERIEVMKSMYQTSGEPGRRLREFIDERNIPGPARPVSVPGEQGAGNEYGVLERAPAHQRPPRAYGYDERYLGPTQEQPMDRERSPELVDRRYKLNNVVVYRDERQANQNTRRTPSRYARYESVRLENDRARSRSPIYVKMAPQAGQYRERSPSVHPLPPEPAYHSRTPQPPPEDIAYERVPRQEYYRVYEDPRVRQPQYTDTFEYVQVSDPLGDYVIRRPIRRDPEPVYAPYQGVYSRPPVYETRPQVSRSEAVYEARAPISRADPAYYEEYDPRHPAPPSQTVMRQVRYQ